MQRFQTHLNWAVVLSQMTHVFCCGLPALFSVLSVLSGLGVLGALPSSVNFLHEILHEWEMPLLIGSGVVLALGWALHIYSRRLDCLKMASCQHKPCAPKKKKSEYILLGASALFFINVVAFLTLAH